MRYIISLTMASLLALPATAEVPRVVTDIPPVQSLVAQVMGDLGTPALLLDRGGDAHAFQLRPSQAAELAGADLIVWIGPEMTPWLDRTLDGATGAAQLRLLSVPGTLLRAFEPDPAGDHTQDGHTQDDHAEDDHAHATHSHGGTDPHAWLDPRNAQTWVTAIAGALSAADPQNAATYLANAAAAQRDLAALDAEVAATLAPAAGQPLTVFHDAYGYFAGRYGLTLAASLAMGDAAPPGAAHLRAVQAGLAQGTGCIFPEVNHDPGLVAAMADGTAARIGVALDPEGAALTPGSGLYAQLLRGLATAISECLAR